MKKFFNMADRAGFEPARKMSGSKPDVFDHFTTYQDRAKWSDELLVCSPIAVLPATIAPRTSSGHLCRFVLLSFALLSESR